MNTKTPFSLTIPADIPQPCVQRYRENMAAITHNTGKLMLFAADQKIEHLNDDFWGPGLSSEINDPRHLFEIAQQATIGALATHPGLIARYGTLYKNINYIAKLNGKTNLVTTADMDPLSKQLWTVEEVIRMRDAHKIAIRGVGYTLYIGSTYESEMLNQAAHLISTAHQYGLITVLWVYPRGKAITNDTTVSLLAGAAGLANALGADFVKIKPPAPTTSETSAQLITQITQAAGNTKVICSGGDKTDIPSFLTQLHDQVHVGMVGGSATGRNIFQHSLRPAIALSNAISSILFDQATTQEAITIYNTNQK